MFSWPERANAKWDTSLTEMLLLYSIICSPERAIVHSPSEIETMKAKSQSASSQPTVMVDSEVVRKIRQHARSCNTIEVCGILIGQDRDHRVEVAACIEGENAEGAGAHVTFTQSTWEHIY